MIPRIIHQIYFDFGRGSYRNIPDYCWNHDKTGVFCKENKIELKFWNEEEVEELIETDYPEFWDTYKAFPHKIMKVDFAKYIILHKFGGIYLDMDVKPMLSVEDLFQREYFFVRWNNSDLPYNAVMGSSIGLPLFHEILLHSCESYEEKKDMPIYQKWFGRFVYQTTGHHMINRVLKNNKILSDQFLNIMFINNPSKNLCVFPGTGNESIFSDANTSAWYSKNEEA
tara:strand:+ start:863 stop:1540 length:678 start_codon:yes stop_codon:yes gene_type:complete